MKIVVIGAGVAGLAIGWRLVQAGAEVIVLDRTQPVQGATWAAAGMIGVTSELGDAGDDEIQFARHSNSLWPDFAKDIEAQSGHAVFYRRSGALMVAADKTQLDRFAARAATAPGLRILDAAEVRAMEPMLTGEYAGALWAEKEASVDSRALGNALAIAFQQAGGRLELYQAVVDIETDGVRAVAARAAFGTYKADAFVIAAGAWSAQITDGLPPVLPVKGEVLALTPPSGTALPAQVVWGNGVYLVPRRERLLVGATVETAGYDTACTQKAEDYLLHRAIELMPALAGWTLADHWAGLRPRSADGLPLLGPTALPGLYMASGQYRNGILFAPAIAELMAAIVLGKADPIAAFDPRRARVPA